VLLDSSSITAPFLFPKHTRSKGPSLRRHCPTSTVPWPSPTSGLAVILIHDVAGATCANSGSPPITQITFPACRAQYPGGPNRCLSVSSLFARPSPVNGRVGIHDFTFGACSSFTRVTACKVAARPRADFCPEASTQPVTRPSRSVATTSYRQLHGWILLPLVICAVGAHR
jgi:hypothetical protein